MGPPSTAQQRHHHQQSMDVLDRPPAGARGEGGIGLVEWGKKGGEEGRGRGGGQHVTHALVAAHVPANLGVDALTA